MAVERESIFHTPAFVWFAVGRPHYRCRFGSLRWARSRRQLVSELVDVIGEAVEGVGGFVDMRAVVGALAGLDHHYVLVEGLTVLAAELDADGSGDVRAAAAAVHTGAAVLGPVLLQAGAAGVGELHWLAGLLGSAALLSFLRRNKQDDD